MTLYLLLLEEYTLDSKESESYIPEITMNLYLAKSSVLYCNW